MSRARSAINEFSQATATRYMMSFDQPPPEIVGRDFLFKGEFVRVLEILPNNSIKVARVVRGLPSNKVFRVAFNKFKNMIYNN